jgi:hypothetical protein
MMHRPFCHFSAVLHLGVLLHHKIQLPLICVGRCRRFSDLPISQLPDSHEDPKVEEGLRRIRELDHRLSEKSLEAMLVARETFPDKYAEQERKRLDTHSQRVEALLRWEGSSE